MTPEKQAALIAEWLEKPPGTPPPEGVDPDAIEAIYALKPQRAPAPRVSIDDILTGVGEGPFFEAKVAELPLARDEQPAVGGSVEPPVAEQPEAPAEEAQVIDLAARRRRRIWGGVGVAAMAALVLFSIAPEDGFENLADAPLPAEQAAPSGDRAVALEDAGERQEQAKDAPADATLAKQQAAKPSSSAPAPEPEPAQLAQEWEAPPAPPAEAKEEAPSSGRYDQLELSAGGASYGDDPTAVAGNTAVDADPGYFDELEVAEAEEEVLADEGLATQSISESVSRKTAERVAPSKKRESRRTRGESSGSAASSAPAVADMEYDYGADDADDYVEEPIPTDLDGLRAAAVPADYSSSWYLKALSDDELDRFDKAVQTGDESSLIGDPNVLIGQDMAYRAAKAAMGSDPSQALSWVRAGQKRSSANTAFLANLYYLEGRILERQGDVEAAKRSYTTAANLNRAR